MLVYLLPSLVFALIFRILVKKHPAFFVFYLSGTFLHELAHFCFGFITNARPVSFSVLPRRTSSTQWVLGSVSFANIRWYNAVFVGMAPLLTLLVPLVIALYRQKLVYPYGWQDVLAAALIAPIYLGSLPSQKDLLISLRSWPYFVSGCACMWWMWGQ